MRVVAGTARGRRLVAPEGSRVRPTADRVREAVFNALGSMGAVEGAEVLDLFAGSGALGIEALSRGARRATFVDDAPAALRLLRRNLSACDLGGRAEVVRADALQFLAGSGGGPAGTPSGGRPWDLALLDPPYRFENWDDLLGSLRAAVVVIESDREVVPPAGWQVVRVRRYGATVVTIAEGRPPPPPGGPTS